MLKLSDTQLVILSAAAQRQSRAVQPLPKSLRIKEGAVTTVLKSPLKKGLVAERPAAADEAHWRKRPAQDAGHRRNRPVGDRDRIR